MYIRVNAVAGAKKESVQKIADNRYEISVREPAERNLANARIRTLLARELGVVESSARLISGHQSPHKIFSVN
jgi:uncharacterized protein YggU (UPF0235/DUF167 family)